MRTWCTTIPLAVISCVGSSDPSGIPQCDLAGPEGAAPFDDREQAPLDVPRASELVDLAGDLREFAAATPIVIAASTANATFRLLWSEDRLYVAATVTDGDLRVTGKGDDGPLYNADGIAVMLDPRLTRTATAGNHVRQVIASIAGDLFDARGAGPTGDAEYDIAGLQVRSIPDGTINDGLADAGYQLVVSIPWSEPIAAGQRVGVDLALDNLDAAGLSTADWAGIMPFEQPRYWRQVRLVPDCP
jgi:hypothetical protein